MGLVGLLLGVLWSGYILSTVSAQVRPTPKGQETRYTFALVGVSLDIALSQLIDKTQISLVYETELVEGKTSFCRARQESQERILACILKGTGLDYSRLSSGTYVLFADARTRPQYGRITGRVIDAATGEPLANANILLAGENTGTATNDAGRFAFAALKPGPHLLVATHVAYHDEADTVWVAPTESRRVDLAMDARTVLTTPVVISGFSNRLPSEDLGRGRLSEGDLDQGAGPNDVVQDIEAIVGVRVGDALSDVHVQGGASGEHQFMLDGATVFVPIQNGGFIGPFSPFAVQQITVQKAGFEASHGSHLSGVIEVEHRIAPAKQQEVVLQADPFSVNGRVSGKTTGARRVQASWMASGRAGLWGVFRPQRLERFFKTWGTPDLFLSDVLGGLGGDGEAFDSNPIATAPVELGYSDIHSAVRVQRDGLHSLYASFYRGRNIFGNEDQPESGGVPDDDIDDEYAWTNMTSQLRYEGVLSSRAFATVGVWASTYNFSHPFDLPPFAQDCAGAPLSEDFNEVSEQGLRAGWNYAATGRHFLSGNVEAVHVSSEFALSLDPLCTNPSVDASQREAVRWRWSAFLEDQWALSDRATLTFGSRFTLLPIRNTLYAEPRLAFRYDHPEGRFGAWAFRGAVGLYRQFINPFDVATYNTTALVPSVRFWLPLGTDERPANAIHVTGALSYTPTSVWQLSVESFYKHHPHLLVLDYCGQNTACQGGALTAQSLLTEAKGEGYGIAFSAQRTTQKTRLRAQYEYAQAQRRVANRFGGVSKRVPWNTPHRIYAALDVMPMAHLTTTLRWQGVAGRAWGFRQAYYDYLEPNPETQVYGSFDLSDPEAHRLPFFSQWDVGVAYGRTVAGFGLQGRFNLINALGRRNVRDWSLLYDEATDTYTRQRRRATPFIPSLALRVTW